MEIIINEKFVLVKNCKIWFAHIDEVDTSEFGRNMYQCTVFADKKDISGLSTYCKTKLKEKKIAIKEKNFPLKDGDKKANERKFECENEGKDYNGQHYEGKVYFKMLSKEKPTVTDIYKNQIDTSKYEFEGCECNIVFVPWIYNKVNKGITFILKGIQVINEGEERQSVLDIFEYEETIKDEKSEEEELPF